MNHPTPIILYACIGQLTDPAEFRFDLPPMTEQCLRYWVYIEPTNADMKISMNGYTVEASTGENFSTDVTDFVTLEDNHLVIHDHAEVPKRIWLQAVPCPEQGF